MKTMFLMMAINVLNIVTIRMQNIDYEHNKSLRRAIKELILIDKHRAIYKGLFP